MNQTTTVFVLRLFCRGAEMKFSKRVLWACGFLALAQGAHGQSISASDIAAMVDERMGAIDAYSELLNDPDPDRALAAMQIMIGIDDPQISRMALMNGLTSTTPAVRRAALKGYFDSQPNLEVFLDGTGFDPAQFTQKVSNASGTVDGDGNGYLTYRVGAYDDGMGCYVYYDWTNQCLVKLSESTVTIMLWKRAAPFGLDETGTLKGDVLVGSLTPAAKTSIPVRP